MKTLLIKLTLILCLISRVSIGQTYSSFAETVSAGGGNSASQNYTNFGVTGESFVNYKVSSGNLRIDFGYIYMTKFILPPNPDVGIDEVSSIKEFNIYPNPTSNKVYFRLKTTSLNQVTLEIQTVIGQTIRKEQWNNLNGQVEKTISLANQASGVYFLQLSTPEGQIRKRIVLE